jgi:hypothetical protein
MDLSPEATDIVVVTSTAMIWTLMTLGVRIFIRTKINGPWGADDWACLAATVTFNPHPLPAERSIVDDPDYRFSLRPPQQ